MIRSADNIETLPALASASIPPKSIITSQLGVAKENTSNTHHDKNNMIQMEVSMQDSDCILDSDINIPSSATTATSLVKNFPQSPTTDPSDTEEKNSFFIPYAEMMKRVHETVQETLEKNRRRIPIFKSENSSASISSKEEKMEREEPLITLKRFGADPSEKSILHGRPHYTAIVRNEWKAHVRKASFPSSMTESEGDEDDLGWEFEDNFSGANEEESLHAFREDASFLEYNERDLERPL